MFSRKHVTVVGRELSAVRPGGQNPAWITGPRPTAAWEAEAPSPHLPIPRGPCISDNSSHEGVVFRLRQSLHMNGQSHVPEPAMCCPIIAQASMSAHSTFAQLVPFLALAANTSVLVAATA